LVVPWRGHAPERALTHEGWILNGLSIGAIVGERYRIVTPLARGGFGAVYVAEQLTTERRVALKVLARFDDNVPAQRLLAEARVTSRIVSEHIVQVIDAGVDTASGDVFVVMELLHGVTLDDRVMDHGALAWAEVAEIMRQVAAGLDKAHSHLDREGRPAPIVHRDLKPGNIFLTERDDGQTLVKLLDFGAAKVLSPSTKVSGIIRGTPQFMASEQAMGEPSSEATDIWAFGLIAFYLLTGRSYWLTVERSGTQDQLFAEILTLPLVPPRTRLRELGIALALPPEFDHWFSRCVSRDRAQRFASAGLAAGELSRLLGVPSARVNALPLRCATPVPLATATLADSAARQLETHDIAALSSSSGLPRPARNQLGLAALFIVLAGGAGAAAGVVWKQAALAPAPSSISANSAIPSARALSAPLPPIALATSHPAPSAAPPVEPASVPSLSRAPGVRPPAVTRRPIAEASVERPPVKADPYEQR
jgi:eukaryotic-like serine/threonine-protein kinase